MRKYNKMSGLAIVKDVCTQLEEVFDVFTMDKVWSEDGTRVTICFTADKLKPGFSWKN